jgi:hypothetical protein
MNFHAGGNKEDLQTNLEEYRSAVRKAVGAKYKGEFAKANFWQRVLLDFRVTREVSKQVKERFGEHSLYVLRKK